MRTGLILFVLIFPFFSFGQDADSLLEQYRSYPNDTAKVSLLYNKGFSLRNSDLPSSIKFAQACYRTSQLVKDSHWKAKALNLQAVLKAQMGMNSEALRDFERSLQYFIQSGDTLSQAITLNNIANIYVDVNTDKAFSCYERSLALAKEIEDDHWVHGAILGIAALQVKKEMYGLASENFETVMRYAEKAPDYDMLLECYKNIGACKLKMGDTLAAESYQLMVMDVAQEMEDEISEADALLQLAEIYGAKRDVESLACLQKALQISARNKYTDGLLGSWKALGAHYMRGKKYEEASVFILKHDSAMAVKANEKTEDFSGLWKEIPAAPVKASGFSLRNIFQLAVCGAIILILIVVFKRTVHEQKEQEE